MSLTNRNVLITIILIVVWTPTARAEPDEIRMIELTNELTRLSDEALAGNSGFSNKQLEAQAEKERVMNAGREAGLNYLARIRMEMRQNGFAIVPDEAFSNREYFAAEIQRRQIENNYSYDSLFDEFGYNAVDLGNTSFRSGTPLGMLPSWSDDERIHEMAYVYEFSELGRVILEELSFGTIPDVRIAVAEPAGNVIINGYPGSYTVSVSESGDKALTTIDFLTADKRFTLTAFSKILEGTPNYRRFVELAEELY